MGIRISIVKSESAARITAFFMDELLLGGG
jgi:hypothetical protein